MTVSARKRIAALRVRMPVSGSIRAKSPGTGILREAEFLKMGFG